MKHYFCLLMAFTLGSVVVASPQGVPAQTTVTCGVTSSVLVPYNQFRGYLLMQNQGTDVVGNCHLKAGAAITGTEGLWIKSGQNYETVEAFTKQAWYCKCDSAAQTFEVLQTNY